MKRLVLCLLLVAAACSQDVKPAPATETSEKGEKLYVVRGVIMSRNPGDNSLSLNHEEIPGFMAAMQMDYVVRGATIDTLPADKSRIEAKLHVTNTGYWITDVKKIP
jgi:hypothetical protein